MVCDASILIALARIGQLEFLERTGAEEARDTALLEGLSVVGLLAFLVRAKAGGIVREVRPLLDALKRQGFFISDELYQHVLRMAGEL